MRSADPAAMQGGSAAGAFRMPKWLQKPVLWFRGLDSDGRIYFLITLACICVSFINTLQTVGLGLSASLVATNLACVFGAGAFLALQVVARTQPRVLLSLLILAIVSLSWYQTGGYSGGGQYYLIFCFIVPVILLRGWTLAAILAAETLLIGGAFALEYLHPDITLPYKDRLTRYWDISFSLLMSFLGASFGVKPILHFLVLEKKRSETKNAELTLAMSELHDSREELRKALAISDERKRELEREIAEKARIEKEARILAKNLSIRKEMEGGADPSTPLVCESPAMQEVVRELKDASRIAKPVLVTGETGTGKEVVARLLHRWIGDGKTPFVAINCAAVPHSLWEAELFGYKRGAFTSAVQDHAGAVRRAEKGVLFLDEIGEIPIEIQAKLLRLLQENTYQPVGSGREEHSDCRFVFATNRAIPEMVREGKFREDLYYRINVFSVDLPPLRKRREDILPLLTLFLEKYSPDFGIRISKVGEDVVRTLLEHSWPGNVRELENLVIRSLALMASSPTEGEKTVFLAEDLPPSFRKTGFDPVPASGTEQDFGGGFDERVRAFSEKLLRSSLEKAGGNKTKAAKLLGLKRTTLAYKLKEFGMETEAAQED